MTTITITAEQEILDTVAEAIKSQLDRDIEAIARRAVDAMHPGYQAYVDCGLAPAIDIEAEIASARARHTTLAMLAGRLDNHLPNGVDEIAAAKWFDDDLHLAIQRRRDYLGELVRRDEDLRQSYQVM